MTCPPSQVEVYHPFLNGGFHEARGDSTPLRTPAQKDQIPLKSTAQGVFGAAATPPHQKVSIRRRCPKEWRQVGLHNVRR
eukprot:CAMPEP_0181207402 /NCGR_PEP_ID=MMETSP1096-20121128/21566_1 /TAXON_ID=156174 ORGANISM="Chrysochromulina ericina, Strain CCMP281" /NCGR_SAMPLE_ID=MMETSP1096 /ASSEMBLY_ACC=CAM_ASM_000453 /LENGTH=79 /DNA_ID=CAMNT_0023298399 /DNA_START=795 /DNA_END=1030 /DNA_ORIENTATION=+